MGDSQNSVESRVAAVESDLAMPIESLLLRWQATGERDHFERLIIAIELLASRMAKDTLRRLGVRDPSAVDDTLSLVFDHLRRLAGSANGERSVAPFSSRTYAACNHSRIDSGRTYVLWLTRERAADVARANRRRSRRVIMFSQLDTSTSSLVEGCVDPRPSNGPPGTVPAVFLCHLHDAILQLPSRERLVVELLLEGKTQAIISHALDCCEGTVSRLRTRAVALLRDLLAECADCPQAKSPSEPEPATTSGGLGDRERL